MLDIRRYSSLEDFFDKNSGPFYYFSTKAAKLYTDPVYSEGAYLVFGKETAGLPETLIKANLDTAVRLPMLEEARSLNLSNSEAVAVYEVLRQHGFSGLLKTGKFGG